MIDWAWIGDHLDDIASRSIQHLQLAAIAVVVGVALLIIALVVLGVR